MRRAWQVFMWWMVMMALPLPGWAASSLRVQPAVGLIASPSLVPHQAHAANTQAEHRAHHGPDAHHASPGHQADHGCCAESNDPASTVGGVSHHHGECGQVCLCCIVAGPPTGLNPPSPRAWHPVWDSLAPTAPASVSVGTPEKPPRD